MTDGSGSIPSVSPTTRIENNRTRTEPIDKVAVDGPRRELDHAKVAELMKSIQSVGLLNPILVVVRKEEDGDENVRLVAGLHRLEAMKQLGKVNIQCTVLERDETLRVQLAEIDENIIRNNPSPAEHAMLTERRAQILKALADHDAASVRDQARRTGESKDKIHRSKKRGILGDILNKVRGTSLDKGVELDALAKLSEAEREDLANRAATGEEVSARTAGRKPKPEPQRPVPTRQRALAGC